MTVSVVIPTYQRREYVVEAVRSALVQSRPASEVIVVDDGSTDGTAQALAQFGDGIRYLHKEHGGPSSARNSGVQVAHGDIIALLDSDDRWLPHHVATALDAFARHPQAVVVTTRPGFGVAGGLFTRPTGLIEPLPRLLIGSFIGYPSCTAIRREALIAVGGYDEELPPTESYDLLLRLARLGPFSLVRGRTVVRGVLPDSLHESCKRSGRYLAARERIGEKLAADLGTSSPSFDAATRSYRGFVAALRAFDEGDRQGAGVALAESCRLMPERSMEPWLIGGWLGLLPASCTPEGRLATFRWAAQAWPEPASRTAMGLRLHASVQALRLERPGLAARLLVDCAQRSARDQAE